MFPVNWDKLFPAKSFVYFFLQSRFVGYLEHVFSKLNGRLPASVSHRIKNIKIDGISGKYIFLYNFYYSICFQSCKIM